MRSLAREVGRHELDLAVIGPRLRVQIGVGEYGVPAVVGAPGVTTRIATGQRITVNGSAGLITLDAQAAVRSASAKLSSELQRDARVTKRSGSPAQ